MAFVPVNDVIPSNSYIANAGETSFVFTWFVFRAEYVSVYKNDVLLVYLTDFNIPNSSVGSANGGNIILTQACVAGDRIVIARKSLVKRTSGYTDRGEFRASAVNNEFNYLVTVIQELLYQLDRSLTLAPSDANSNILGLVLPKQEDRLGKYLVFDQNGNIDVTPSTGVDLFYNWVRFTASAEIPTQTKKAYASLSAAATLKLPVVNSTDDGKEILILNPDTNAFNLTINVNSATVTIDGSATNVLSPGYYRSYIYNHTALKWITLN
jgi:hypothetical protein